MENQKPQWFVVTVGHPTKTSEYICHHTHIINNYMQQFRQNIHWDWQHTYMRLRQCNTSLSHAMYMTIAHWTSHSYRHWVTWNGKMWEVMYNVMWYFDLNKITKLKMESAVAIKPQHDIIVPPWCTHRKKVCPWKYVTNYLAITFVVAITRNVVCFGWISNM
jgi:hypothetical protein